MPVAAIAAETLFVPDLTLAREHLAIAIILGGLLTSCQFVNLCFVIRGQILFKLKAKEISCSFLFWT